MSKFCLPLVLAIVIALAFGPFALAEETAPVREETVSEEPARTESADGKSLAQRLYRECSPSVVSIIAADREGERRGIGTGFVFGDEGFIATNLHVIGRSRSFRVQTKEGQQLPVEAIHAFDGGLDLAILKVAQHEVPPLKLGISREAEIGQDIVVLGNPQGLESSVVAGVLSATRQIDTRDMLQLAIPIEPGNSGGPVLDRDGQVLGIVTMKSSLTDNLGFAVSIEHLKQLLEKPNPVDYDRWLTIGVLDEQAWEPMFGSKWTQRAGRILVEESGDGFGGRSLCLKRDKPQELPYEVSVLVKVNEADGAAGLAFLSDGHTRHYGLYLSSGRVRVTRFDGPTVYQWTVLEETVPENLNAQTWTHLKIRVEKENFSCYVNDKLIYEAGYDQQRFASNGRFGLVKFRHTTAEFKQLNLGEKLPSHAPDAEALQLWKEQLAPELVRSQVSDAMLRQWSEAPTVAQYALQRQAEELREQAAQLEQLSQDIHVAAVLTRLKEVLDKEDWSLFDAGMLVARLDDAELDIAPYRQQLEALQKELQKGLPEDATAEQKREYLRQFLFEQNGFHGSRSEYYSRANSYLSRVLDDREGIPVTLGVVYLEMAAAIGLKAEGVGLPGHFVVRVTPEAGEPFLVDVFDAGERLTREEAEQRLQATAGVVPQEEHFRPLPSHEILERMLGNLVAIAQNENDLPALLRYYQALALIDPDSTEYQGMKALLLHETGRSAAALEQLTWLEANMGDEIGRARLGQMRDYFEREQ